MSNFEWVSSVISSFSLIATIFFGDQVYKLSKQANNIAKKSVDIQQKQFEKDAKNIDKYYINGKLEKKKFNELEKDAKNSRIIYKELLEQQKDNSNKKWIRQNIKILDEFLKRKR